MEVVALADFMAGLGASGSEKGCSRNSLPMLLLVVVAVAMSCLLLSFPQSTTSSNATHLFKPGVTNMLVPQQHIDVAAAIHIFQMNAVTYRKY
eukprot:5064330-Amphidinium_carterae.1